MAKTVEVPNVMSRQNANKGEQVGAVPLRRADKGMWLRSAGGSFTQGDIKGTFSTCIGISDGPVALVSVERGDERRQYVVDLREFIEAVLDAEAKVQSPTHSSTRAK